MKKIVKKTRTHKILGAVTALNKAMAMEESHVRITSAGLGYGIPGELAAEEFSAAIKTFVKAYKKYYGLEKINLELAL